MFAPLNGSPLNGGASGLWATGTATATATAKPATNRVYTYVGGTASVSAGTHAVADRLAYANGVGQARADTSANATRYAGFAAESSAGADTGMEATRYAHPSPVTCEGEASTAASFSAHRYVTGRAEVSAESTLADDAVTRLAFAQSDTRPALARSWIAESHVELLRVRQRFVEIKIRCRAEVRALFGVALATGRTASTSEVVDDNLKINTYHDFRGSCEAVAESLSVPDRFRILSGAAMATAETHLAPTIIRDGVRYSYNEGVLNAGATIATQAYATRWFEAPTMTGETGWVEASYYRVRGMRGGLSATAETRVVARNNHWQWARGVGQSTAAIEADWQHYRWREAAGVPAVGAAETTAENIRRRMVGGLSMAGGATTRAENRVIRSALIAPARGAATSSGWNWAYRYGRGQPVAMASITAKAHSRRGRLMTAVAEAVASSSAEGLRTVWMSPQPAVSTASAMRFVFRVNVDGLAPARRTIELPPGVRLLALPASTREYRVT